MKNFNTGAHGVNKYMDLASRDLVSTSFPNSSARGLKSVL